MGVMKSHGARARMEEGNVTNNLYHFFPDFNRGLKIDREAFSRTLFCCKWYQ